MTGIFIYGNVGHFFHFLFCPLPLKIPYSPLFYNTLYNNRTILRLFMWKYRNKIQIGIGGNRMNETFKEYLQNQNLSKTQLSLIRARWNSIKNASIPSLEKICGNTNIFLWKITSLRL